MSICSKCNIDKNVDDYYKSNKWVCKSCLSAQRKDRYLAVRDTEEYKKKHAAQNLNHYHKCKDSHKARQKKYRESENGKEVRKSYIQKNKEKIYSQESVCKKKYHEKNRDSVTDQYAANLLRTQGVRNPSNEQIEIKKVKCLISRVKKKLNEPNN